MKHAFRTPFDARLPSGWPLRVGLILLAALLASPVVTADEVPRVARASVDRVSAALASDGLGSPGDENWTAGFGAGGLSDAVHALAIDADGNLYAGGYNGVAKWDGSKWSNLGLPWAGGDVIISSLAVDGTGNLYAGGDFYQTVGEAAFLAKWDGSSWTVVSGTNHGSYIYALATDSSGNLFVGGDFDAAGGVPAKNIAKWDGSSWSALGAGVERVGDGSVRALALDGNGNLYTGGDFYTADGVIVNNIAKWNGSSWSALGSGQDFIMALAMDDRGNLYAGGYPHIAKWDGSSWSFLGSSIYSGVDALAIDSGGNLYGAGPDFTSADGVAVNHIAKWDGSSWSALGSGVNDGIHALAADKAGNLYAGGHFTAAGGKTSPFTARWAAADGRAISGPATYTFYAGNLPVTVLVPPDGQGDLARINIQRFNTSYPGALPPLLTGYYWQLEGLNGSGGIASGYMISLTLPVPGFTPDENARVCRRTRPALIWDCAATSYTAHTITRDGVMRLSDWAVSKSVISMLYVPFVLR
jgi:hypothetical protein